MNILDSVYGTLFKPQNTLPDLINREYFAFSFFIIIFLAIINSFKDSIGMGIPGWTISLLIMINLGSYLFIWLVASLLITFSADLLGGAGKITDTMIVLAFAAIPLIFLGPAYILSSAFGSTGEIILLLLKLIIYLWVAVLALQGIKYSHKVHITQSVLSLVGSVFLVLVLIMGAFVLMVMSGIFFALAVG